MDKKLKRALAKSTQFDEGMLFPPKDPLPDDKSPLGRLIAAQNLKNIAGRNPRASNVSNMTKSMNPVLNKNSENSLFNQSQ